METTLTPPPDLNSLQTAVGRNIHDLRMRAGLSQEALADDIGLHRSHIGEIERGRVNVTLRTLLLIARRLGVGPGGLLEEGK